VGHRCRRLGLRRVRRAAVRGRLRVRLSRREYRRLRRAHRRVKLVLVIKTRAPRQVAGHVRVAIDSAARLTARTAPRHRVVVLRPGQRAKRRALKAAHPGIKVLLYQNLSMTSAAPGYASGVSFRDALSHPSWFLADRGGQRINSSSWSYLTLMDPGVRSYQRRWARRVVARLKRGRWDGVYMDDVNTSVRFHTSSQLARYATDAGYQRAVRSALAYIGPRVRAARKLAIANIGGWNEHYSAATGWLRFLSGAMQEHFAKWGYTPGVGYLWDWGSGGWLTQLRMVKACERRGKLFLALTNSTSTDRTAARYGWATLLLAANGHSSFALAQDFTHETWFPEYDYPLGRPRGRYRVDPNGVYRRRFARGLVLVNPTNALRVTGFGGVYSGSGLGPASAAIMAPHSGLVLHR
jgi:Hypothetical glycosyl hydrolase family 15